MREASPKITEEPQLDLRGYRNSNQWRVEETVESLFFIDTALPSPNSRDMQVLLEEIDRYHERVRAALDVASTITELERRQKLNTWLYAPDLLEESDLLNPNKPNMFYGTANAAGIHLVSRGMAWDDPIVLRNVLHEIVHHWWTDQVGEAPSLLNEGIAVYFEHTLFTDVVKARGEFEHVWREYSRKAKPGFLRLLCTNEGFWAEYAAGEPVYRIGAQFVSFLLDDYGLKGVRRIFLESHFDDPEICERIEKVAGESIDSLEKRIAL